MSSIEIIRRHSARSNQFTTLSNTDIAGFESLARTTTGTLDKKDQVGFKIYRHVD